MRSPRQSHGGSSSETFRTATVRCPIAAVTSQAGPSRSASTTTRTGGMYASSSSTSPPTRTCGATYHQSSTGYGKPCAPSSKTRSSGRAGKPGSTSCDGPILNRTDELSIPRRSHSRRMRSSSPGSGVTASWSAPAAANTSVDDPEPVSSVAISRDTLSSSQPSAPHASPQYSSPAPCRPGGEARRSSVSRVTAAQYHRRAWPRAAPSSPGSAARTARCSRSSSSARATRSSASSAARPEATRTSPRSASGSS